MPKKKGRIGGFAAQNSGTIKNCYSVVQLSAKGYITGGFAGENSGSISSSYSYGKLKGLSGGFSGNGGDNENNCYFFHEEREGSKRIQKLSDTIRGQRLKRMKDNEDAQELGFDTETIWQRDDGKTPLRFITENWMFDVTRSAKDKQDVKTIRTAEELWELAKDINSGDRGLAAAHIHLEEDIDLGGKEWIPIGRDRTCAFTGLFDGGGHVVKNFVLKDKKIENKGFFGFIKGGEVYNLSVDCNMKGGACCGGLVGQNEEGIIGCCAAIIEIKGKNGVFGGLVGRNTGEIFESYTAGRIKVLIIPWWWALPFPLLLLLLVFVLPKIPELPAFAPVPYDEDQIPIPDEEVDPNGEGNFVSFQFEQKIDVSLATGQCKFGFKNPGNSNHNIVVQLQFTDAQAKRVMGSTGRSEAEQKKLEDNPGYDPENNRIIIAESGAIRPGYQLEDLQLVEQEDGATIPPGDYNAMVYLVFYDIETNNRAMLESQLPVVVTVHE